MGDILHLPLSESDSTSTEPADRVEVSVHEVENRPGDYIVRMIKVEDGVEVRRTRWLVEKSDGGFEEARALYLSLCRFLEAGLPASALFPDGEDDE